MQGSNGVNTARSVQAVREAESACQNVCRRVHDASNENVKIQQALNLTN